MANNYFKFKQFIINQEKCAMKVGTDGCLLGAWADLSNSRKILDVGCGSGLIAIMAAQRCPQATITGIEIDEDAVAQSQENSKSSPWSERIKIIHSDFLKYAPQEQYDTILSNPPYFTSSLKCPDDKRTKARHSDTLSCSDFLYHSYDLLLEGGKISIVIPFEQKEIWCKQAENDGFTLTKATNVHTRPNFPPKRVLLEFTKGNIDDELSESNFILEEEPGKYSDEAINLLKPFYLKM